MVTNVRLFLQFRNSENRGKRFLQYTMEDGVRQITIARTFRHSCNYCEDIAETVRTINYQNGTSVTLYSCEPHDTNSFFAYRFSPDAVSCEAESLFPGLVGVYA